MLIYFLFIFVLKNKKEFKTKTELNENIKKENLYI